MAGSFGGASAIKAGEAYVEIGERTGPLRKGLANLKTRLEAIRAVALQLTRVLAGATLAMGVSFKKTIELASELEETQSKFSTVFKEQTVDARDWGLAFAKAFGLSRVEVLGLMAALQDAFVPLGFARKDAAEMSKSLVQLANDLRSFNPTMKSTGEVVERLSSGLVGNHEVLRIFGIIITENSLKTKLATMGIGLQNKKATEQQKVLARLSIIMDGTSDAQGDAARTADSWKNQLSRLRSGLIETGSTIGERVIPVMKPYLEQVQSIVERFGEWVAINPKAVEGMLKMTNAIAKAAIAAAALTAAMTLLSTTIGPVLLFISSMLLLADAIGWVDTGFQDLGDSIEIFGVKGSDAIEKLQIKVANLSLAVLDTGQAIETLIFEKFNSAARAADFFAKEYSKVLEFLGLGFLAPGLKSVTGTIVGVSSIAANKAGEDLTDAGRIRNMASAVLQSDLAAVEARIAASRAARGDRQPSAVSPQQLMKELMAGGPLDLQGLAGGLGGAGGSGVPSGGVRGFFGGQRFGEQLGSLSGGIEKQQLDIAKQSRDLLRDIASNTDNSFAQFAPG